MLHQGGCDVDQGSRSALAARLLGVLPWRHTKFQPLCCTCLVLLEYEEYRQNGDFIGILIIKLLSIWLQILS